jgi:hypothetical protein
MYKLELGRFRLNDDGTPIVESYHKHHMILIDNGIFTELDIKTAQMNITQSESDDSDVKCIADDAYDRIINDCRDMSIKYCKNISNLTEMNVQLAQLSRLRQILDLEYMMKCKLNGDRLASTKNEWSGNKYKMFIAINWWGKNDV